MYFSKLVKSKQRWIYPLLIVMAFSFMFFGCKNDDDPPVHFPPIVPADDQVQMPIFTPPAGSYDSDQNVSIACPTQGATIYYTTDESEPTTSSPEYSVPVSVAGDGTTMTIKAIAVKIEMEDSDIASAAYVIDYSKVSTPMFLPPAGSYDSDQNISISCSTPGATIYYTTDESEPTTSSPEYSVPVSIAGDGTTMTIKAIAVKIEMKDSDIASAAYVIDYSKVLTPMFLPQAGNYDSDQNVSISCSTPGATIYYTTDESEPTTSSPEYSVPVSVAGDGTTMTIKAIAVKIEMKDSDIPSAAYIINYNLTKLVSINWNANREKAVNSSGGGYRVYYSQTNDFNITGADFKNIQWVSGLAPTSTDIYFSSGTWYFKVVAYSALNSGSASDSSTQATVIVP